MITGTAAGVPFVARPPDGGGRPDPPVVVAWHLLDSPRTPAAFAAAVPLAGLDAWRVYFGLPMTGARLPEGGEEELRRRVFADPVLEVYRHVVGAAVAEFPAAFAERTDFVTRAGELTGAALLFVTGEDDFPEAIVRPVATAVEELRRRDATVQWRTIPGMAHALADEPGVDPAPQTAHAAEVDALAAAWFTGHLRPPAADRTTADRGSARG